MSYSNSSLNTYLYCEKKYKLCYIDRVKPDIPSPHLGFGEFAHKVLYDAGCIRDYYKDGVVDEKEYLQCIPSEVLHNDWKQFFGIKSWKTYFSGVIKQVAEYEKELCEKYKKYEIHRELTLQLDAADIQKYFKITLNEPLKGIIDLLILGENEATIIDYKFSSERKDQADFDMNSQLQLYALLVNKVYKIPLQNIVIGYIDIPKVSFDSPTVLSNGTLSRAKAQNILPEMYKKAIIAIHGDDSKFNCEPGGYYYDCYCSLQLNRVAYLNTRYIDVEAFENIVLNMLYTARRIFQTVTSDKPVFLSKCDSYSCKKCEYLKSCKSWLNI